LLRGEKGKMGEILKSLKAPYFFFAPFFTFFLAALATVLTSELLIGVNLYLKFAKAEASRLAKTTPKINRSSTIKQPEYTLIIKKDAKAILN